MEGSKKVGDSRPPPLKKPLKSTATTKRPNNKAPSEPSRLLELAPEIRNHIFQYVLVSDEPVKVSVQLFTRRGRTLRRLLMLPGLINACKQLRHETQTIFFNENTFEITNAVLKERSDAPLLSLRTMHQNMGLGLSSMRVCQVIKKRVSGVLFQMKADFTFSSHAGSLTISNQNYSATYLGRSQQHLPTHHIDVCGCDVAEHMRRYRTVGRGNDVVEFLLRLKDRFLGIVSYQAADLNRTDEVVYRLDDFAPCRTCSRQ